ncbi:MAG: hypothetical protein K2N30_03185 [Clostridia bacterium]|nr:hypothetical protein [Clostridia bacterium]
MKKLLSILILAMLLTAICALAACKDNTPPKLPRSISAEFYDEESEEIYYDSAQIYHLKTGKQYYFGVRVNNHDGHLGWAYIYDGLTYNPEEVEISSEVYESTKFPVKGLKNGSAIIQYDGRHNEELVKEGENYLKILIIFG